MTDWTLRPYDPQTDDDTVLYMFIRSYAGCGFGRSSGAHYTDTPEARTFWDQHRDFFAKLVAESTVTVACDPERVRQSALGPPVIWGWVAHSGPVLHYVCVKRAVKQAGIGVELVRELLRDFTGRPTAYTLDQVELWRLWKGARAGKNDTVFPREDGRVVPVPRSWYPDFTFHHRRAA